MSLVNEAFQGLPPSARSRVERQLASGTRSSLFSAPAVAAANSAGLTPIGEVFGCAVMRFGYAGTTCGWYGPPIPSQALNAARASGHTTLTGGYQPGPESPIYLSGRGRYTAFTPYVKAFEAGWNRALERMLTEAHTLRAHGVVGIRLQRKLIEPEVWEFSALGTAVRSTDVVIAPHLEDGAVWSTTLTAEDTASAILSGFIPREVLLGLAIATKHEDWQLMNQRSSWDNQEIEGMSKLIQAARHDARSKLEARATRSPGGQIVITDMELHEFVSPCGGSRDYHAEARVVGTTLVPVPRFRPPTSAHVSAVVSLRDRRFVRHEPADVMTGQPLVRELDPG